MYLARGHKHVGTSGAWSHGLAILSPALSTRPHALSIIVKLYTWFIWDAQPHIVHDALICRSVFFFFLYPRVGYVVNLLHTSFFFFSTKVFIKIDEYCFSQIYVITLMSHVTPELDVLIKNSYVMVYDIVWTDLTNGDVVSMLIPILLYKYDVR